MQSNCQIKIKLLIWCVLFLCYCNNRRNAPNIIEVQTAVDNYFLNEKSEKVYQDKAKYSIELENSLSNDDSSSWHYYVQNSGYITVVLLYFKKGRLKRIEEYYEIKDNGKRTDVYNQLLKKIATQEKQKNEQVDYNVAFQKDSTIHVTVESLL